MHGWEAARRAAIVSRLYGSALRHEPPQERKDLLVAGGIAKLAFAFAQRREAPGNVGFDAVGFVDDTSDPTCLSMAVKTCTKLTVQRIVNKRRVSLPRDLLIKIAHPPVSLAAYLTEDARTYGR